MLSKNWYDDYRRKGIVIAYDEKSGLGVIGNFSKKSRLLSYLKLNTSLHEQVYLQTGLLRTSERWTESPIYFFKETKLGGIKFADQKISIGQVVSFTAYGNNIASDLFLCHQTTRSNPLFKFSNFLIQAALLGPTAIATFLCLATDRYSDFQVFWWQVLLVFVTSFFASIPIAMILESKIIPRLSEFDESDFSKFDSPIRQKDQKEIYALASQILINHPVFLPEELKPQAI